ncbi:DinB family protein [Brevibacillus choshinensis]|uniref:DinB family protein n=1 Tax=Brevibacillus choshinensis TaxID=54911 RepID=UPI002E23953B|nr:DinB family protein [Brevibacillus choshinensis]
MATTILNTGKTVRQIALHQIQSIPEEKFDIQPEAFNHTIRWNVGHIVFALDFFFSLGFPFHSNLPESYAGFFHTGTKPSDWTSQPPSKEELMHYLSQQLNRLSEISPAIMDEILKAPIEMGPVRFETVGEVCNFAFCHEAMHLSTISSLLKVIECEGK